MQTYTTYYEKLQLYKNFIASEDAIYLIVVGLDNGGERKHKILHMALEESTSPHGGIVIFEDNGLPLILPRRPVYPHNPNEDYYIAPKTIYILNHDDIDLAHALERKYDACVVGFHRADPRVPGSLPTIEDGETCGYCAMVNWPCPENPTGFGPAPNSTCYGCSFGARYWYWAELCADLDPTWAEFMEKRKEFSKMLETFHSK